MGDSGLFTIGELARRTGLTTRTIRFYSDEGLLPPADRTYSGYRLYDAASLARLELLRTLRELGLGLDDAAEALAGRSSVVELAKEHVSVLDEQIRVLRHRRAVLRAVVRNGSELDEVKVMKDLAAMTDEERRRLIEGFWDEVLGGLDMHPDFEAAMRSAKPELPDDPTPEQLQAWIELAELVRNEDFRRRIRGMGEHHAATRARGEDEKLVAPSDEQNQQWWGWSTKAGEAMERGLAPSSPEGRALAEEVSTAMGVPPGEAADALAVGTDARAERYWQLMGIINGWEPVPTQVPKAEWIIAALRAAAG
ncbi:MerR family transcriptional regulator [Actinophytocola gossypii]|uniref:MerR family transcriptional regulator n=1 Tax=Actinophytocola gossypii TaxID=2812003 RepID=A0ABT2J3X5_9PSEU|nr:MerR family transcriptional regulator [Actinophytocola gossypii]MCT2582542.1 MerR family transcriptional regulator [Actinophytocola gossypii]